MRERLAAQDEESNAALWALRRDRRHLEQASQAAEAELADMSGRQAELQAGIARRRRQISEIDTALELLTTEDGVATPFGIFA